MMCLSPAVFSFFKKITHPLHPSRHPLFFFHQRKPRPVCIYTRPTLDPAHSATIYTLPSTSPPRHPEIRASRHETIRLVIIIMQFRPRISKSVRYVLSRIYQRENPSYLLRESFSPLRMHPTQAPAPAVNMRAGRPRLRSLRRGLCVTDGRRMRRCRSLAGGDVQAELS